MLGLGYIGLPTAAVLSRSGHRVIGVDVSSHVLDTVNQGRVHIVEPDLEDVVADAVSLGSLTAQQRPSRADVFQLPFQHPFAVVLRVFHNPILILCSMQRVRLPQFCVQVILFC